MKKVLYVEDSATSQLLMRKYLANLCELTIAVSPRAGLELVQKQPFDLVITDFLFPDTDATGLVVHLRKSYEPLKLPIIVVSGSMDLTLLSRMLRAGANDGMAKPLNAMEFRGMVDRMLKEPYIRTLEKSIASIACFQWSAKGLFHEYCPEIDVQVSAPTRDEVSRLMFEALQAEAAKGIPLGFTTHEKAVTHLINT